MKKFISTILAASILSASIIVPVQAASFGRAPSPRPVAPSNSTKPTAPAQTAQHSNFSQNQSWGMQRPQVTQQMQSQQTPKPTQPVPIVAPAPTASSTQTKPPSSGMNPVTAGALGAGAGLLLGTAVGSAMATPTNPSIANVPNPYNNNVPNIPAPVAVNQPQVQATLQPQSYQPIVASPPVQQPTTTKTGWASFWDGIFGLIWFGIILVLAVIGWIMYRNREKVKSVKDAKDIMVHEFSQAKLTKPAWKPESKLSPIEHKIADAGVNRDAYKIKTSANDIAMDMFTKVQTAFNQCDVKTLENLVSPEGHHLFQDLKQFQVNMSAKMPHTNITCEIQDDGSESGIISAWFTAFDAETGIPVNEIWHIKDGKLKGVTQN